MLPDEKPPPEVGPPPQRLWMESLQVAVFLVLVLGLVLAVAG